MANKKEKDPDFIKLLEGLKGNKHDIFKLPSNLIVNFGANTVAVFSNNRIDIISKDSVWNITRKAAQLAYKDKFIQENLFDYEKIGDERLLLDTLLRLSVYHFYNDKINILHDRGIEIDVQKMMSWQDRGSNELRKEINKEKAQQKKENKEGPTK